ncbi:MAG: molecular chaperone SurA [Betaproteobacteria bacterium]|nr:MAG: molecular chaperone SurA [Betaproteobacteria bacterium]
MRTNYLIHPLIFLVVLTTNLAVAQQSDNTGTIKDIDHIIAIVNEECITRRELDEILKISLKQLQKQGIQPPANDVLEKRLLEREILSLVQLQLASEIGMTIGDTELDQALTRIAKGNKMTKEEFYSVLRQEGISYGKFREEIRKEMLLLRLKEREVIQKIKVSEGEVDNFLYTQANLSDSSDEYLLSHIMVRIPEQASVIKIEIRRQHAEAALAKLKNGDEFAEVAAAFSDAADALKGGKLGWRPVTQLPINFSEVLKLMKPGELTQIIRSSSGFHILKLLERRSKIEYDVVVIDQSHVRHILIKVNELTSTTDAQIRITRLKERLDNDADFEELARLHSEDFTASAGGDLGWVSPGDTVAEFEQAMNGLQLGMVSEPVQSTFGWHLIQVIDRRTKDVSNEQQRRKASKTIRARKSNTAFQEWLQQLRDQAYVEYRYEDV